MTTTADVLIQQLKHSGLRITPQRIAICNLLAESKAHPTAAMIFDSLREAYPSLSLMTVYNTLNRLAELGVVNVLGNVGDDSVHYDADTEPHVNLACVICKKIVDIPCECVAGLNAEVSAASGYQLLGARVLYYGVCPDCQSKA